MNKHEYLIREIPSGNYDVFYKDVHIGHCDWKDEAIDIVIDHACTRAESAEAERDEARRKLAEAQAALLKIHDQSYRASLVQDRSVYLIKEVCRQISIDAKDMAVQIGVNDTH